MNVKKRGPSRKRRGQGGSFYPITPVFTNALPPEAKITIQITITIILRFYLMGYHFKHPQLGVPHPLINETPSLPQWGPVIA